MKRDYKDDCIHLHACRRICKHWRISNRACNDSCKAYQNHDDYMTGEGYVQIDKAIAYARDGADSIRAGYSEYDVYAPQDLKD